jgi:hypothetical protein
MPQQLIQNLQRLSWDTPLIFGLASAAVGSVVTLVWLAASHARQRKRQRWDTALDLALSLESYARTCRTMMHRAAWAAAKPIGPTTSEASKGVSLPTFAYPERVRWDALSRRVISELREYPAIVHGAREYVEAFREFADPVDVCEQVEYECAKAAVSALSLARVTRRRHGAAAWRLVGKYSTMESELSDFVAKAEAKRKGLLKRPAQVNLERSTDTQPFKRAISA